MNRGERRRAERELARSMRRATVESAGITASCAWPRCRAVVAVGAPSLEAASDKLRVHYAERHGGREPQPVEGDCRRCGTRISGVPGAPLLCVDCREPAG